MHGAAMPVPTYDQLIEPILRYLAATPEGATARDAHEAAADALNLSEAQRQALISSGQATYKNRAGWAHDRLKRAGLSDSLKRGYWQLTQAGLDLIQRYPEQIPAPDMERIISGYMNVVLSARNTEGNAEPNEPEALAADSTLSPDDRLEQDRKSTRLNSSHVKISYAVFCLKKKKTKTKQ